MKAREVIEAAIPRRLEAAMRQATQEILASRAERVYGGGRPPGRPVKDAYDINCGLCEEWANRVEELCPEAQALGVGNLTGDSDDDLEHAHIFIRHRGKFYDAECPQGVADWKQLPLFSRRYESEDPKSVLRALHDKRLDAIYAHYGTTNVVEIFIEAAALRDQSPHEEFVTNDRAFCKVCGWVDQGEPDPIYHPEHYFHLNAQ